MLKLLIKESLMSFFKVILTITLPILCLFFIGLSCQIKTPPPNNPIPIFNVDIDLGNLNNRYIDLSFYKDDTVFLSGSYKGDRLVFKNVSKVVMVFADCIIESTHKEDAIVFDGLVDGLKFISQDLTIKGGGITFWNLVRNTDLAGGVIHNTHTAIRATSDKPSNVGTLSSQT